MSYEQMLPDHMSEVALEIHIHNAVSECANLVMLPVNYIHWALVC